MSEASSSTAVAMVGDNLATLISKMRDRSLHDLYFTLTVIFHKNFLDGMLHPRLSQFYWDWRSHPHHLVLAPRNGGKSTIRKAKIAARLAHASNPSTPTFTPEDPRQLLISYDKDKSVLDLNSVLDDYLLAKPPAGKQDWVPLVFPRLRAYLSRAKRLKDTLYIPDIDLVGRSDTPHLLARSIDSGITGLHMDIDADDLVGEVEARSPAECERATDWVKTSINALEHQLRGHFGITGTHYHLRDPYAYIIENHPDFVPFIHEGLISTPQPDGTTTHSSYWNSKFSVDDLIAMRTSMTPYKFAALIQQNPTQHEDAVFDPRRLNYWRDHPSRSNTFIRQTDGAVFTPKDFTIVTILDPALPGDSSRCDSANLAVAMDPDGNYWLLEEWAAHVAVDVAVRTVLAMGLRWEPDLIACEDVLFQSLLIPMLSKAAQDLSIAAYNVQPVAPRGRSKAVRILAIQALLNEGRIFVNEKHDRFITELMSYPHGRKVDVLDAFAYAPEVLYPPTRTTITAHGYEMKVGHSKKSAMSRGNRVTGY